MKVGMLWFDDSSRPLAEKVARAAAHYAQKYGRAPTACYVPPSALDGANEQQVNGVTVHGARNVPPNHLWIGMDEA